MRQVLHLVLPTRWGWSTYVDEESGLHEKVTIVEIACSDTWSSVTETLIKIFPQRNHKRRSMVMVQANHRQSPWPFLVAFDFSNITVVNALYHLI